MKIQTVNVVEYNQTDENFIGITSFSDDAEGNKEAEEHFLSVIKENGADIDTEEDKTFFLVEGNFEKGGYQAVLIHS